MVRTTPTTTSARSQGTGRARSLRWLPVRSGAALVAVVAALAVTGGCADSVRGSRMSSGEAEPSATTGRSTQTDQHYDDLFRQYVVDGDRSEDAIAAYECVHARDKVHELVCIHVDGPFAALEGLTDLEIRALVEASRPDRPPGWADTAWEACPAGGTYAVHCYEGEPSSDGTRHWRLEIVCSVHTPEAWSTYLEDRGE